MLEKEVEEKMIYFMKGLPEITCDMTEYKPFIRNEWFRKNYMMFVYVLQLILIITSVCLGVWSFSSLWVRLLVFFLVFFLHELLHIIVVFRQGDISLTHSGIFLWINSDAHMSKNRFWLFMTLPFLGLTVIPMVILLFVSGEVHSFCRYVLWVNAIIAGSDIINSVLIAIKPGKSMFYRGYYKV